MNPKKKKKIATVWLAGCSGCHMSLLDIDERILDVVQLADIVRSPIVDGKEFPEVDVTLIEGAVASDEHVIELLKMRDRTKILVSLGDCAVTGNVSSMRNFIPKQVALERSYLEAESNEQGVIPDAPELQRLIERVRPLHEVVEVDYFIPGCPPSADAIFYVINELLHDRVPDLHKAKGVKYG
jgi:NAD-reducing hydrogenase small subunit